MDRVKNKDMPSRAGIERELASRADQRVLRCFRHVEKINEYCMARWVLMAEVSAICLVDLEMGVILSTR